MLNNKKTIIIFVVILAIAYTFGISKYYKYRYRNDLSKLKVTVPYEKPDTFVDHKGISHSRFKAVELERDFYRTKLDSVAELLDIKRKQINSLSNVTTETSLHLYGDTVYVHDTVYQFKEKTNYYDLSGQVSPTNWKLYISLEDTLHYTVYTKNYLFSPDKTILDISNTNPYVHIKKGNMIVLRPKKKHFSIGPYLGYDLLNQRWSAGISLQYSWIKF